MDHNEIVRVFLFAVLLVIAMVVWLSYFYVHPIRAVRHKHNAAYWGAILRSTVFVGLGLWMFVNGYLVIMTTYVLLLVVYYLAMMRGRLYYLLHMVSEHQGRVLRVIQTHGEGDFSGPTVEDVEMTNPARNPIWINDYIETLCMCNSLALSSVTCMLFFPVIWYICHL